MYLKECPFCGHQKADLWKKHGKFGWFFYVKCSLCGATAGCKRAYGIGYDPSDEPEWNNGGANEAIKTWNTRATEEQSHE